MMDKNEKRENLKHTLKLEVVEEVKDNSLSQKGLSLDDLMFGRNQPSSYRCNLGT